MNIGNTKMYIKSGGEWLELSVTDFKTPEILQDLSESMKGSGFIDVINSTIDLSKQLRIKPKLESWKGKGKRRMKVIK